MSAQAADPVFTVGRMVSWFVVGLMIAAVAYAAAMALLNWSTISV